MSRYLGTAVALAVIVLLAFPFGREAYHHYEIAHQLDAVMNAQDRAAFQAWQGDAQSFGRSLLDRCELDNGSNAASCRRYRLALQ